MNQLMFRVMGASPQRAVPPVGREARRDDARGRDPAPHRAGPQDRQGAHGAAPLRANGDRYVVIASKGGDPKHPAWYLNLRGGEADLQVGREHVHARARDAEGEERAPCRPGDRLRRREGSDTRRVSRVASLRRDHDVAVTVPPVEERHRAHLAGLAAPHGEWQGPRPPRVVRRAPHPTREYSALWRAPLNMSWFPRRQLPECRLELRRGLASLERRDRPRLRPASARARRTR